MAEVIVMDCAYPSDARHFSHFGGEPVFDFRKTPVMLACTVALSVFAGVAHAQIVGTTDDNGNTAIGLSAGQGVGGSYNIAIGLSAGQGIGGSSNTAIGVSTGQNATGSNSFFGGSGAGNDTTGSNIVAIGTDATGGSTSVAIGSGASASAVGSVALGAGSTAGAADAGWAGTVISGKTMTNNLIASSVVGVGGRQVAGVADGAVTTTSTDAVNGSQLDRVIQAVNAISAAGALVMQTGGSPGTGNITVGSTTGGTVVDFTGTSGTRILSGVSAGVARTDAVNVSQLEAVSGVAANSVQYDNAAHTSITLGGVGASAAVSLTNVAAGQLAASSTDAVNGSQLFATNQALATESAAIAALSTAQTTMANTINSRVPPSNTIASSNSKYFAANSTGTAPSALGAESVAVGGNAVASAANAVAAGSGAQAHGVNSVAIGANAVAIGSNAVALGQGSAATNDNTVSVGNASVGLTRTISNVAPGVNGTDAVNLNQLNGAVAQGLDAARRYTDRGVSAALAMPSIPLLNVGDKWVGAAVGSYGNAGAVGVAAAYQVSMNLNIAGGISAAAGGSAAFKAQAGYRW